MSDSSISVECPKCNAKLKLKNRSAVGKRVPCPKCKQPFVVTAPAEEDDELAFMNVAEPEPDEFAPAADGDGADEEFALPQTSRTRSRGGKKTKKSSGGDDWQKPLMISTGVLLLVALLVGGGIVGYPLLANLLGAGNKIDTAWLPPTADVIVHVRVEETWNSPFVQSLVNLPTLKPQLDLVWGRAGTNPTRVQSITFGGSGGARAFNDAVTRRAAAIAGGPMSGMAPPSPASTDGILVVRMKSSGDLDAIKEKFNNGKTGTHQGAEYLIPPGAGDTALYFAASDVLVMSTEASVKQAIERGRVGTRRPELDFVDPSQAVLIAIVPSDPSLLDVPPSLAGGPAGAGPSAPMANVTRGKLKGICIGLSVTDKIDWSVATNCTDSIAAGDITTAMNRSLTDAKTQFAQVKSTVPPMMSEFVQLADSILNSVRVESQGDVVALKGNIPASAKSTLEKLPQLMMMGAMMSMPGGNPAGQPGASPFGGPPGQSFGGPANGQAPGTFPPGFPPPGGTPPGTFPSGTTPPGTLPPGAIPPGAVPPGSIPPGGNPPPGGLPPGAAIPPGNQPAGAVPPGRPPM